MSHREGTRRGVSGDGAGLIAVRHAPRASSVAGVCYGARDVEVTLSPGDAADAMAEQLGSDAGPGSIDVVWSSPLVRCAGPARSLAQRIGAELRIDPRLLELDHGVFEGREWDEIHRSDGEALARWGEFWLEEGPPGGESARDLEARVAAWFNEHVDRGGSRQDAAPLPRRHLLVAHAGPVRALHVILGLAEWAEAMRIPVPPLGPVRLLGR